MNTEKIAKVIADRVRLHADNIFIDYYGDEFAERLRRELRDLAQTIEDPTRYDPDPVCIDCGEECGGDCS